MAEFKEIAEALIEGNAGKVKDLVMSALDQKKEPKKIVDEGLIAGMDVVGVRFKNCEMYIPEVLASARAMHAGMEILEPLLGKGESRSKGVFVIGTVKGDLHDIGKNLVAMLLKGAGWKVVDLGVNVNSEDFVKSAVEEKADIIGLSALLTTTMVHMKDVVELVKAQGCKSKVIIGGAPINKGFADQIGAHGYAPDAATAVDVARSLVNVT